MTKYRVYKTGDFAETFVTVEAESAVKAAKASGWPKSKIAHVELLKSALAMTEIAASGTFRFTSPEGVVVTSDDLAAFNATLEKLGYKAVQMTFNLMNQGAGSFLIEADTPWCCNPRSETYWSM